MAHTTVAPLGNDQLCYVKDGAGWKIASRWLRHWLLTVFKEFRPAHFQALCLDARVDLLNEESPRYYYTRPAAEEYAQWQPLDQVALSDTVWRNGRLDLRTRTFTPWPDGQLIFGLLLGHEFDAPLLARIEAGDLPQQEVNVRTDAVVSGGSACQARCTNALPSMTKKYFFFAAIQDQA